jgi:hypothetical protein
LFISRLIPEAYSQDKTLIDILVERYIHYDIFWYHWPTDGVAFFIEDFEPVILIYSRNFLRAVTVRKQWNFHTTDINETNLPFPLRITFDPFHHHPLVVTNREHHISLNNFIPLQAEIKEIEKNKITPQFRIGRLHITNFKLRSQVDPVDYAEWLYNTFYRN